MILSWESGIEVVREGEMEHLASNKERGCKGGRERWIKREGDFGMFLAAEIFLYIHLF